MVRKLLALVVVLAVLALVVAVAGGKGVVSALFGWAVLGYLLLRAAPGIRRDLGVLRGFGGGRRLPGRYSVRRDRGDTL